MGRGGERKKHQSWQGTFSPTLTKVEQKELDQTKHRDHKDTQPATERLGCPGLSISGRMEKQEEMWIVGRRTGHASKALLAIRAQRDTRWTLPFFP